MSFLFQNIHKLIRYLLTPSLTDRPDIYQASHLAFSLKNKKSPIQNLHQLSVPDWSELHTKLSISSSSQSNAAGSSSGAPVPAPSSPNHAPAAASSSFGTPSRAAPVDTVTSVNPRSRPKGTFYFFNTPRVYAEKTNFIFDCCELYLQ